jgi:hypothetical protein
MSASGPKSGKNAQRMSLLDLILDKEATQSRSEAEEAKRDLYRQRVFLPGLNSILKEADKYNTPGGKGRKWTTVRSKLKEAGSTVKWKNAFLYDFDNGYQLWDVNGRHRSKQEAVAVVGAFRS